MTAAQAIRKLKGVKVDIEVACGISALAEVAYDALQIMGEEKGIKKPWQETMVALEETFPYLKEG